MLGRIELFLGIRHSEFQKSNRFPLHSVRKLLSIVPVVYLVSKYVRKYVTCTVAFYCLLQKGLSWVGPTDRYDRDDRNYYLSI